MTPNERHRVARLGSFWYDTPGLEKDAAVMAGSINVHDKETYTYRLSNLHSAQELPLGQTNLPYDLNEVARFGISQLDPISGNTAYTITRNDITEDPGGLDRGPALFGEDTKFRINLNGSVDVDASKFQIFNSGINSDYFLIPIDPSIRPTTILTKDDRRLFVGLNFEYYFGFLVFREDPDDLFEESSMTLQSGWQTRHYALDFQGSYEYPHFKNHWVLEYLRARQDVPAFERAIASIAGLIVIPKSGLLETVIPGSVVTYVFDWGAINVNYPHTHLEVGYYDKGFVIGNCTVSYGKEAWYDTLDWGVGLSLKDLGSTYDVTLPNEQRACWLTNVDYIQMELDGPDQEAFWADRHKAEEVTGAYLNSVLGLVGAEVVALNPLKFMLENFIGDSLIRVDLSGYHELNQEASVRNFILENKPSGTYTVIYTS